MNRPFEDAYRVVALEGLMMVESVQRCWSLWFSIGVYQR